VLLVIHGIRSVRYAAKEIVKWREHCGDIPTPRKAFDEAEEVVLPTQKFEPGKKIASASCCTGKSGINRYPMTQMT
jgi:hypothetical protein